MKKRKWYVYAILAAIVLAVAVTWVLSVVQYVPVYQAESILVIDGIDYGEDLSAGLNSAAGLADAFAELLNSSLMHRTILEELEMEQLDVRILAARIPETNLLELKVTAPVAEAAYEVICTLMEKHTAVTEQVMGSVPITVLQEPRLPDYPENPLALMSRMVRSGLYAACFAILLCIWHLWSQNEVGMSEAEGSGPALDLGRFFADMLVRMRRTWCLGLGIILLCSFGACAYRYVTYQPVFEMSASFTVRLSDEDQDGFPSRTADQLARTMPQIFSGDALTNRIMAYLDVEKKPDIQVSVSAGSRIITLTVRESEPELTGEVLSAMLSCYPEVAEYVVGPTNLLMLEESGIPDEPVNPFSAWDEIQNGAGIGLGLWIIVAMLLSLYHVTIHTEKELSQLLQCDCQEEIGENKDAAMRNEKSILMITSALPGEGKSTSAWNLACSYAGQGKRVLLAECNPYNPALTKKLGLNGKNGLSEYLNGQVEIKDIICKTKVRNLFVVPWGTDKVGLGLQTRNRSVKLKAAFLKLFDCVILDGPHAARIGELTVVAELADRVILVVRKNRTTRDQIIEAVKRIRQAELRVTDAILNRIHT